MRRFVYAIALLIFCTTAWGQLRKVGNADNTLIQHYVASSDCTAVGIGTLDADDEGVICKDGSATTWWFWDGTEWVGAGGVGGIPLNHATRHVTGGGDPIDLYPFTWTQDHTYQPSTDETALTLKPTATSPTADTIRVLDEDDAEGLAVNPSGLTTLGNASYTARLNVKGEVGFIPSDDPDATVWLRASDLVISCNAAGGNLADIEETWNSVVGSYTATGKSIDSTNCGGEPCHGNCDSDVGTHEPSHVCGHCCEWSYCTNILGGCDCDNFTSSKETGSSVVSHVESARCVTNLIDGEYFDLDPDFTLSAVDDSFTIIALVKPHSAGWGSETQGYLVSDTPTGRTGGPGDTIEVVRDNINPAPAKWRADNVGLLQYTTALGGTESSGGCADDAQGEGPDAFGVMTIQIEKTSSSQLAVTIARMNGADVLSGSPVMNGAGINFTVAYILGYGTRTIEFMLFHDVGTTMPLSEIQSVENYLSDTYSLGLGIADNTGSMDPLDEDVTPPGLIVQDDAGVEKFRAGMVEQVKLCYDPSNCCTFTVDSGGDLTLGPAGCDVDFSGTVTGSHPTTSQGVDDIVTDDTGEGGGMVFANDATMENLTITEDTGIPLIVTSDENNLVARLDSSNQSPAGNLLRLRNTNNGAGAENGAAIEFHGGNLESGTKAMGYLQAMMDGLWTADTATQDGKIRFGVRQNGSTTVYPAEITDSGLDITGVSTLTNSVDSSGAANLVLRNLDTTASSLHGLTAVANFARTGDATARSAGALLWQKQEEWTGTVSTNDSRLLFGVVQDGVLTYPMQILGSTDAVDMGGASSVEIVSGTGPTVANAGEVAVDTTDDQFVYFGAAKRVIPYEHTVCKVVENLKAGDDGMPLYSPQDNITLVEAWCICNDTPANCTATEADIDLQAVQVGTTGPLVIDDLDGTDVVDCNDLETAAEVEAIGTDNTVDAKDLIRFDVSNSPGDESMTYTICITYTVDAQ
jgi:hypothetical protein